MNKVIISGRLTKDPEITFSKSNQDLAIAKYTIAVNRVTTKENDKHTTDFIPCIAFGKGAEVAQKYFKKGMKLIVEGQLYQNRWVDKETKENKASIKIIVEKQEFAESKEKKSQNTEEEPEFLPFE